MGNEIAPDEITATLLGPGGSWIDLGLAAGWLTRYPIDSPTIAQGVAGDLGAQVCTLHGMHLIFRALDMLDGPRSGAGADGSQVEAPRRPPSANWRPPNETDAAAKVSAATILAAAKLADNVALAELVEDAVTRRAVAFPEPPVEPPDNTQAKADAAQAAASGKRSDGLTKDEILAVFGEMPDVRRGALEHALKKQHDWIKPAMIPGTGRKGGARGGRGTLYDPCTMGRILIRRAQATAPLVRANLQRCSPEWLVVWDKEAELLS
jgi:hypothetical protein